MDDGWFWALAALGAFLSGFAKTGIAGLGILTVAIFASIMPARESVGVLLVILVVGDLMAVGLYRREASWKHLVRLFPWTAVGVGVGAVVFDHLNDMVVRVLIGAILVVLVVLQLARRRTDGDALPERPQAWLVASTGLLAGFTTMVANAAGPLMILYLLAMRLPKLTFVGTAAWFFLAVNLFKVPFSYSLGLLSSPAFALSLRLVPFAMVGALSGRWLITYINQRLFEGIALVLTLIAGLRLLVP